VPLILFNSFLPNHIRLMSLLAELQSLACLVSLRPEVTVHLAEKSTDAWSFNWLNACIAVNPADYKLRPPDYCRGLLLHESAHAAITRYHAIIPEKLLSDPALMQLMNAVEDCRIENWLQQRLPGCAPWIALYNNHCFGEILADTDHIVRDHAAPAFLLGLLSRWWFGKLPVDIHPLAAAAIEEVWPSMNQAVALFPSAYPADMEATRRTYSAHPASVCYAARDPQNLTETAEPDGLEMEARMTQHQMWALVESQILPVFRRLLCASGEEEAFARWAQMRAEAQAETEVTLAANSRGRGEKPMGGRSRFKGHGALYAEAVRQQHADIEQTSRNLLRYLTAEIHLKTVRGQPSGPRLDLKSAMQFAADPRQYNRLWQRQHLPQRPDPHFLLLVDVSSSMRGERAASTFLALVTLREVCLRTGIALSIVTFGSTAELAQGWENPTALGIPAQLESVARPRDDGTDLGTGLRLVQKLLAESPFREKMVWVLSDGEPHDAAEAKRLVQQLRSQVSLLIGLGLGPDTEVLGDIIPDAYTNLTPRQLPALIPQLFQWQVRHA
jgi:Mg-chelatase subunit ChlD